MKNNPRHLVLSIILITIVVITVVITYLFTPLFKTKIESSHPYQNCPVYYKGIFNDVYYTCNNYLITIDIDYFLFLRLIPIINYQPTIDSKTIQYLGSNFSKDKNHVYYLNRLLLEADPDTFIVLFSGYAKDKNNVYLRSNGQELPPIFNNADPLSFEILEPNGSYAKDKNGIYYFGRGFPFIIRDADYLSFKCGAIHCWDKYSIYFEGEKKNYNNLTNCPDCPPTLLK